MKWKIETRPFYVYAESEEEAKLKAKEYLSLPRAYVFPDIKNIEEVEA